MVSKSPLSIQPLKSAAVGFWFLLTLSASYRRGRKILDIRESLSVLMGEYFHKQDFLQLQKPTLARFVCLQEGREQIVGTAGGSEVLEGKIVCARW